MQKVKQALIFGLLSDLEIFLDNKRYQLNNVMYMQIMITALAVYETTKIAVLKFKVADLNNKLNFLFSFLYDDNNFLYFGIINIY